MLEFLLITIVGLVGLICFTALIAIGYRHRLTAMTVTANYNAALWAESESRLYDVVVELAKQEATATSETQRANDAMQLAYQALAVARGKVFEPETMLTFHCPQCQYEERGKTVIACPQCGYCGSATLNESLTGYSRMPIDAEWPDEIG